MDRPGVSRIRYNMPAFFKIESDPQVLADLKRRADAIAAAAGESLGYVSEAGQGKTRARAAVITGKGPAVRDCAANNTLLRVLDEGRK